LEDSLERHAFGCFHNRREQLCPGEVQDNRGYHLGVRRIAMVSLLLGLLLEIVLENIPKKKLIKNKQ